MQFELTTSGTWYSEEEKTKLETLGFKFSKNTLRRSFFKEYFKEYSVVGIEIHTLEDLMKFVEKWERVIIHKYMNETRLELYDQERE
jgi:hypothetical protein